MKRKFWSMAAATDDAPSELRIEGEIVDDENAWWFEDDAYTCPGDFRTALNGLKGDLTVVINSIGGDAIAASCIYSALRQYAEAGHRVTARVNGLAASAASVIAMAADVVQMSPTAYMMVHDPSTYVYGNAADMDDCKAMLDEVANGMALAYARKTGMEPAAARRIMKAETWLNAASAKKLGFADEILWMDDEEHDEADEPIETASVNARSVGRIAAKLHAHGRLPKTPDTQSDTTDARARLNLLCAAIKEDESI